MLHTRSGLIATFVASLAAGLAACEMAESGKAAEESARSSKVEENASSISVETVGRFHLSLLEYAGRKGFDVHYLGPLAYSGEGQVILDSGRGVQWQIRVDVESIRGRDETEHRAFLIGVSPERERDDDRAVEVNQETIFLQYLDDDVDELLTVQSAFDGTRIGDLFNEFSEDTRVWEASTFPKE